MLYLITNQSQVDVMMHCISTCIKSYQPQGNRVITHLSSTVFIARKPDFFIRRRIIFTCTWRKYIFVLILSHGIILNIWWRRHASPFPSSLCFPSGFLLPLRLWSLYKNELWWDSRPPPGSTNNKIHNRNLFIFTIINKSLHKVNIPKRQNAPTSSLPHPLPQIPSYTYCIFLV